MRRATARRQRGAIAVLTGFTIAVLIAFMGIAVDLGRLFVVKAELQTAMDACALAAASGLRPGLNDPNAMNRARAFGKAPSDSSMRSLTNQTRDASIAGDSVPLVNRVPIEDLANRDNQRLDSDRIEFAFGSRLDNVSGAWSDNNTARYARCSYPLDGVAVYFMRVIGGSTSKNVRASSTATMAASSGPVCTFPLAMCNQGGDTSSVTRWGLTIGQWQQVVEKSDELGPGKFGWANLDGGPANNNELKEWIEGGGYCGPLVNNLTSGAQQGAASSWNSRFGLYRNGEGNPQPETARPDYTGYGYDTNWSANPVGVNNAYSGTDLAAAGGPNEPNYRSASAGGSNLPYQGNIPGFNRKLTASELANGENRRIVPVPVIDCTSATPPPLTRLGIACVLLLHPINAPKDASIEFLGRGDEVASCRSAGTAGGTGGGTFVPVLVQ